MSIEHAPDSGVQRAGIDDRWPWAPDRGRLSRLAASDEHSAGLVGRLLRIGLARLPSAYVSGRFAYRVDSSPGLGGGFRLTASGTSTRYTAIAALGLARLPETDQRAVLAGDCCRDLVTSLVSQLDTLTSLGDVALTCWAAAETGHPALRAALARLAEVDSSDRPAWVVDASWTVSALVAARSRADVEQHLARAVRRLLAARGQSLFRHIAGTGKAPFRAHVGSFADQVYPLQALARLHASSADMAALSAANQTAEAICAAQGPAGQWWWHYDARTGGVVEGYPVYSVHQHAMAPMALFDLAEAGGDAHLDAVSRGLRWLADPPETAEPMLLDDPPVTWRKVARGDPRKLVRGLRATATSARPSARLGVLDRLFPPGHVDHECRPYELGWLLFAWLS
jgi:hypothetical protein